MYSSIMSRPSSGVRDVAVDAAAVAQVGDEPVDHRVEGEIVGVVAPRVALGLVAEAVRLPRDREAQVVPVVTGDRLDPVANGRVVVAGPHDPLAAAHRCEHHARSERREIVGRDGGDAVDAVEDACRCRAPSRC